MGEEDFEIHILRNLSKNWSLNFIPSIKRMLGGIHDRLKDLSLSKSAVSNTGIVVKVKL